MEEPILRTKRFSSAFGSFLGIILFSLALTAGSISLLFSNSDNRILGLIGCFVFGFLSIVGIRIIITKFNVYEIYIDSLRVISFLGKEKERLQLSDIKSWTQEENSSKSGTYYILIVYTDKRKIKFNSSTIGNDVYDKIKAILTSDIQEDRRMELQISIHNARQYIWVLIGFILLFLWGFLKNQYSGLNDLKSGSFTTTSKLLSKRPTITYESKGKGTLTLYFDKPTDSLIIDDYTFKAINIKGFADSFDTRDSIYIEEVKDPAPTNFMEKLFGNKGQHVCGLYTTKFKYLVFASFSKERRDANKEWFNICGVIVLVFTGSIFINLSIIRGYRREVAKMDKPN